MVTKAKAADKSQEIQIVRLTRETIGVCVVGTSPLILHRLAAKAQQELLMPSLKKNAAERAQSLKHDPYDEFRASAHTIGDPKAPTLLALPATSFKNCMRGAALELAGASKAQIGRLTFVEGEMVPIYGIPKLHMGIVRMSDPGRTPDVRTRVIVEEWCALVSVVYVRPQLTGQAVANLLDAAGLIQGVGDWRPEKGNGNFGQFEVVAENDVRLKSIMKSGRQAQTAAMAKPQPYNEETRELLTWFDTQVEKRQMPIKRVV